MWHDDFTVQSAREGEDLVVRPIGDLDIATVARVEQAAASAGRDSSRLVLDLGEVGFADTSGLRLFVALDRRARAEGFELTLRRCSGALRRIMDIAGLSPRIACED